MPQHKKTAPATPLSLHPSPLAGEGQGEGYCDPSPLFSPSLSREGRGGFIHTPLRQSRRSLGEGGREEVRRGRKNKEPAQPQNHSLFGLYIHYPYCLSKCPYCDFASASATALPEDVLLKAYKRDIDFFHKILTSSKTPSDVQMEEGTDAQDRKRTLSVRADPSAVPTVQLPVGQRFVTSIFFGGGTPSLMSEKLINNLLHTISQKFNLSPDVEITLEANPDAIDLPKMRALKKCGINRLSLGVQSMTNAGLKQLGRRHSLQTALTQIDHAKKVFDNINIDLIYARPNQSLSDWESELSAALALDLPHYSFYQLTVEEETPFFKQNIHAAPDPLARAMYIRTKEMTENHHSSSLLPKFSPSSFPSPEFLGEDGRGLIISSPLEGRKISAEHSKDGSGGIHPSLPLPLMPRGGRSRRSAAETDREGFNNDSLFSPSNSPTPSRTRSPLLQYEVSNYSKPGFECRHNLCYWRGNDYIGIGPAAHGRLTLPDFPSPSRGEDGRGCLSRNTRYEIRDTKHEIQNTKREIKTVPTFLASANARTPLAWVKTPPSIETLSATERNLEKIMMHLRLTREPLSTQGLSVTGIKKALQNGWITFTPHFPSPSRGEDGRGCLSRNTKHEIRNKKNRHSLGAARVASAAQNIRNPQLARSALYSDHAFITPTLEGTLMLNQLILLLTD